MEKGNIGFILGMVAGEGCFSIKLSYQDNKYVVPTASFRITLKFDDGDVLEDMRDCTNIGRVRYYDEKVTWMVEGWDNCKQIADDIEIAIECTPMFKSTKKYDVFQEWVRVIENHKEMSTEELIKEAKRLNDSDLGLSEEEWMERVK